MVTRVGFEPTFPLGQYGCKYASLYLVKSFGAL